MIAVTDVDAVPREPFLPGKPIAATGVPNELSWVDVERVALCNATRNKIEVGTRACCNNQHSKHETTRAKLPQAVQQWRQGLHRLPSSPQKSPGV